MIPVLIRPTKDGYRAELWNEVISEVIVGKIIEEVQKNIKRSVQELKDEGNHIFKLDVTDHTGEVHPLARFAGDLADSPLYDDWVEEMKSYRAQHPLEILVQN